MDRRRLLNRALQAGALLAVPSVVPAAALGKDGEVAPSERIVMGGIGRRGSYVLKCFMKEPEVRMVACADPRVERRDNVKQIIDTQYGNHDCVEYRDFRELLARSDIDAILITTGSNNHALLSIYAARAGKDVYCEKPCTKTIAQSLALADTFRRTVRVFQGGMQRRNVPQFDFAIQLARLGKLGRLQTVHAHPSGLTTTMSGWRDPHPEPPKEQLDWDLFLGSAPWRPFNAGMLNSGFEKGGGLTGGGCLEWGSHCIDMCQWANNADDTAVLPTVLQLAQGGPEEVRIAAIRVLTRLGNVSCVPVLLSGDEAEGPLSKTAVQVLTDLPGQDVDRDPAVRLAGAQGKTRQVLLGLAGQRHIISAVPTLRKAIDDPDVQVREAAMTALGATIEMADLSILITRVVRAKNTDDAAPATKALSTACRRISDQDACAPNLITALADSAAPVKCRFLEILSEPGGQKALGAVTAAKDSDPEVQDAASRLLGSWMSLDAGSFFWN
jgi:hypothetical protein